MSKTILLADDSVTIQKVVELAFLEEDFEVVTRPSGSEALAHVEKSSPAVLVCDIHMPGMDGYEVCRRAREIDPELPVLLLVGTFESFDEDRYRYSGAQSYLRKPFDSQELVRRVRELASRRENEEEDERTEVLLQPAIKLSAEPEEGLPTPPTPPVPPPATTPEQDSAVELEEVTTPERPAAEATQEGPPPEKRAPAAPIGEVPTPEDLRLTGPTEVIADFRPPQPPPTAPQAPQPKPRDESPPPSAARSAVPPAARSTASPAATAVEGGLSDADVDRIARRVVEMLGDSVLREVAWEVVPDLAEVVVRERLEELERQVEEL